MARRSIRDTDSLQVEGLNETLRGLGRVDKDAAKEVKRLIRERTKTVAQAARAVDSGSRSQPSRSTSWIGYSVTNTGAGILLRAAGGRAYSSEFGASTASVGFDAPDMYTKPQDKIRGGRRTFQDWSGSSKKVLGSQVGYVIQPTIRKMMPWFERQLANDLVKWVNRKVEKGR